MKRLVHIPTRRQLFRTMAAGAASVPFLAHSKESLASGNLRWWRYDDHGRGDHGSGNGGQGKVGCLSSGTSVSTPAGERAVEELRIGDEVQTLAGRKAINWIGHTKFMKEEGRAWHDSVMPIRVARFAIDDRSPHSDLYLSPLHCVFFNETLIPVKYLINGSSVAKSAPSETNAIEYYHIDLETHEVIYAEGALVESFFDGESGREHFSNFVQYERLYGAEPPKMTPFAPILGYRNRREKIKVMARSLISNVVDLRDAVQIAHDQIARRAEAMGFTVCL